MRNIRILFVAKSLFLLLFTLSSVFKANSQAIYEYQHNEIYNYLSRMAQKGLIRFDDNIRPLSRIYLGACLDSLSEKKELLSSVEKKELVFYLQEYNDRKLIETDSTGSSFFKKDGFGRWRSIAVKTKSFVMRVDPVLTASTIQGSNNTSVRRYSSGFNLNGYAGKHWGYYVVINDVNETGTGLDTTRQFTPQTGIVSKITYNKKSQNYSELRGGISYSWKTGSISLGNDYLLWGYGENGRTVLSDKAPAYPYLRFDYQPLKWLSFHYSHAWLNSNLIDSAKTYPTGTPGNPFGGVREFYIQKFMAMHSIQFTPAKGLDVALGESIIYSDRMEIGYLIPVLFFKLYDNIANNNNINAGSNGQLFLQVSSRNNLPNTHLYGTLFIDEIKAGSIFDKSKSRNQLGYTLGASVTDAFVPYLTLGMEYTRINPFVYRNLIPAQNYSNHDYLLGDWMGNNADRLIYTAKYNPLPKLKCLVRYQSIRKGGPGTLNQQYFQQPQPSFLFDLQSKQKEWYFQVSYQWANQVVLQTGLSSLNIDDVTSGKTSRTKLFSLGITYGL